MGMWVIKNLNGGYYQKLEVGKHKLDAKLKDATRFDTIEEAERAVQLVHENISKIGLGINFEVRHL